MAPHRRGDDPNDFDGRGLRQDGGGNGWSLPNPAKYGIVGVLCFAVLFLIGAVPKLPSPMVLQAQAIASLVQESQQHSQSLMEMQRLLATQAMAERERLRLTRVICFGVTKGDSSLRLACGAGPSANGGIQ